MNSDMKIVLSGALLPPAIAKELTSHIEKIAPSLINYFSSSNAKQTNINQTKSWCSELEHWLVLEHGLNTSNTEKISYGLGPIVLKTENPELFKQTNPDQNIWLMQLVHISPARDGAALIPGHELNISQEQSQQLFNSAQELFEDSPFKISPCSNTHWLVELPKDYAPDCASPTLVSLTSVNEWWRQDEAGRPWRKIANELQMLWFNNAVNNARFEQQQMPINGVWLYGGAKINQFDNLVDYGADVTINRSLEQAAISQDWHAWLSALENLEKNLFQSQLNQANTEIILLGNNNIVNLKPKNGLLSKIFRANKQAWKKWWCNQN